MTQMQRTAGAAYAASADLGEMLVAASAVKPGDVANWSAEWSALAE